MSAKDLGAHVIIQVDPFRCRMWDLHDRLDEEITESSCASEIRSFSAHGQLVPVLGRRLNSDPDFDVELIFGARRLFVARHLKQTLVVEIRQLRDREAAICMDIENRHRTDISAYERGRSYSKLLRSGQFLSQEDLARALNVSVSQVSRLLKVARLPTVVVNAFGSACRIRETWGVELVNTWEDAKKRELLAKQARAIGAMVERPSAEAVYERLTAVLSKGRRSSSRSRDSVVRSQSGTPVFRIRRQRNTIAILIPVNRISTGGLDLIRDAVLRILDNENASTTNCSAPESMLLSSETPSHSKPPVISATDLLASEPKLVQAPAGVTGT